MENQPESKNADGTRLTLHRIFSKNSSFESFGLNLSVLQNPISPTLEMQIFSNHYGQDNNLYQVVLGLKIQAKHQADVIWKIQLEEAGFYTLEGFSEEQKKNILNGFCLNQLYVYAGPVVNQMVTQAGFAPIYLQPMDFYQLYKEQKQKDTPSTVEAVQSSQADADSSQTNLAAAFKPADENLLSTHKTIN